MNPDKGPFQSNPPDEGPEPTLEEDMARMEKEYWDLLTLPHRDKQQQARFANLHAILGKEEKKEGK